MDTLQGSWMAFSVNYKLDFEDIFMSSTPTNSILVISLSFILLTSFSLNFGYTVWATKAGRTLFSLSSKFQACSAALNSLLGVGYFITGLWMVCENFSHIQEFPVHQWLSVFAQSFDSVVIVLLLAIRTAKLGRNFVRFWTIPAAILTGFVCISSVISIAVAKKSSFKLLIDLLSMPATILLLLCAFSDKPSDYDGDESLYEPLRGSTTSPKSKQNDTKHDESVTRFASAGVLSKLSFWWLNPLMKKGYESPLEEKEMHRLRRDDLSGYCYSLFLDTLNKEKETNQSSPPSTFWVIVTCYQREIVVSGFFAFLKIITVSAGPVLVNAFIQVSEGREFFKYDGYVLAMGLFVAKCFESLSQRQWFFLTRKLGLQVRSLLSAAIYDKQLKLSNSAKLTHSSGEIMNYLTVDATRIGEFPFWLHQTWTTVLQLCISLLILYNAIGLATISTFVIIILMVFSNAPVAKLQHKFQTKLMEAQDTRLKAVAEALANMKVLKLYAWEMHFKKVIDKLRDVECQWLKASNIRRAYINFLFWTSPVLVSAATFSSCYFLGIPLDASNVFTFVATLRLVQEPVRQIPNVIAVIIQANVSFKRIVKFLDAPELPAREFRKKYRVNAECPVKINSCSFSWDEEKPKPTLRNINLEVKAKEKVAICGEVGSGKSTLLAAILGEVPKIDGTVEVCGKVAYVSQTAWIQNGTLRDNILFGSAMDTERYQETLKSCSLVKDFEMLPFGDLTEIGERGINLSGGQKQRIQLARALYQNADIYLLDDPFSAVDAHTATSLFNDYVMGALAEKTVLLVTHHMEFLPAFNLILLMLDGETFGPAPYYELLATSKEFQELVEAQKDSSDSERPEKDDSEEELKSSTGGTNTVPKSNPKKPEKPSENGQLIKKEEKERGDTGLKAYKQYLGQNKGYLFAAISLLCHAGFIAGQVSQNSWMAANVQNPDVSTLKLIVVYLSIGLSTLFFLLGRSGFAVALGLRSSRSLFSQLLTSLFRAPMSFFDSTPVGRILSRLSADLNTVDLELPFTLIFSIGATMNTCTNLGVLAVVTWPVLFISVPMIVITIWLQKYYLTSAKELMRINGTTKSLVASHLSESITGAVTIRAFEEEDRFLNKSLTLIDKNASPFFYNFAAKEWLIQRLETMSAAILSSSAFIMVILPKGTFSSGFVGMALSYGLSLNNSLVGSIQNLCVLANYIISVERLNQYMHVKSEAPEIIEDNRPPANWPSVGTVVFQDLKVRYRPDTPLVLQGISCTIEGGHKVGIVGRTGSGKTTLIGALFRLVEPAQGRIIIDGIDIGTIGLHDLRSRLGIIPQDPTLFQGSVRYNLDPLGQYTDDHIWEVLEKCQLREAVREKGSGLDSLVTEDGANWSAGQRQLFCLGRALLRRSQILVLDEATASVDNATDAVLQKTIRTEFADCTVITVAHRIPTVMDCNKVLSISDGKLVEYDEPAKLMKTEGSLFGKLVREYWSRM